MQSPTIFDLVVYSRSERQAALHISARPLSPRFPHPLLHNFTGQLTKPLGPSNTSREFTTNFHIVLEPLILSILPSTAIPTILLILLFALGSALTVPTLIRLIERAASSSNHEKMQ
ncbi:MAG: hypothetical protein TREMPRED_000309 [Tremellales sp. Tagirdzhanova-0007]|nr:MAG: hypothetical protein TREMPRED_000309 [Tremellales sp. Tagirdzhanova-0007]